MPAAAQSLERVRQCAARVFEVMDAGPAVRRARPPATAPSAPGSAPPARASGPLRARTQPWALDGVDLDLPAGRRVGIVGPSGAGKSTLAAVLLRFLPYEGSVTLDGVELATLAGDDVRRVVGLAAQDTHVFDTTLRENLLLARRGRHRAPTCGTPWSRSGCSDWVDELPAGLDTAVGEHGARLSGGQRQRLGRRPDLAGRLSRADPRRARRAPRYPDRRRR